MNAAATPEAGSAEARLAQLEREKPMRLYAWAWRQRVSPDEKLLLLALCTGEAEPNWTDVGARTALLTQQIDVLAHRLHDRGLIDDHGAPAGPCTRCGGKGSRPAGEDTCDRCNGDGNEPL